MRHWAEERARAHLEARGYRTLAANWATPGGELDLVMRDGEWTVFVEVRQRRDARHGHPGETLTPAKLARLREAARRWLLAHLGREDVPVRFDAVLVTGPEGRHELEHLEAIL